MPIYTPTIDYNATANAIERDRYLGNLQVSQRNQALNTGTLQRQGQSLELNNQMLQIQRDSLQLQKAELITSAIIDSVEIGVGIWNKAKEKTEQAQFETAKADLASSVTTFSELIAESTLNQGTKLIQGEDGKWDIQLDPAVINWRDSQLKAIDESDDTPAVKAWRSQQVNQAFEIGTNQVLSGILKQADSTIQREHSLNIGNALKADVQSSTVDSVSYDTGFSVIDARRDLSTRDKAIERAVYKQEVDRNVEMRQVGSIAATRGDGEAITYARSLVDKGYLEEDLKPFIQHAKDVDTQVTTAAVTTVSSVMSKGLAAGKMPQEIWDEVEAAVDGMPEKRKDAAMEAARSVQVSWATDRAMELYVADVDSDAGTIITHRDSIANGDLAEKLFYNIPEVQDNFISLYDKQISAVQKAQGSVSDDIIKINKVSADAQYKKFIDGTVSGNQAISYLMAVGANTEGQEDDVYAREFIRKIQENIVPAKYETVVDDFMDQMDDLNWNVGPDRDIFTPEQEAQLVEAKLWAYGRISDLFLSTAEKDITTRELSEILADIKTVYTAKSLDVAAGAKVREGKATNDMLGIVYDMGKTKSVYIEKQNNREARVVWATPGYKQAFDKAAGQFENELEQLGVSIDTPPQPITIGGEAYPVPSIRGKEADGVIREYTVDRNEIFSSEDNGNTWQLRWVVNDTKFDDTKVLSNELKTEVSEFNQTFRSLVTGSKQASQPQPSAADTPPSKDADNQPKDTTRENSYTQPSAQWADDRVGAYRDTMVKPAQKAPDTTPAEDAARMDRTNAAKQQPTEAKDTEAISTLSERNQSLLRNVLKIWMNNNPGKVPTKDDVASRMSFINEEHIAAMYRILSREE